MGVLKRFLRWLFIWGWLLWLFVGVIVAASLLPHLWDVYISDINTVPVTVFILQFSAFCVFIIRLNKLFKHYDPDNIGYWGAIIRWFKKLIPKTINVSIALENKPGIISSSTIIDPFSNKKLSCKERIDRLEKVVMDVKEEVSNDRSDLNQKMRLQKKELINEIKGVENQIIKSKKETSDLHMQNLGIELVAVLWLIVAALINSFPSSITWMYFL